MTSLGLLAVLSVLSRTPPFVKRRALAALKALPNSYLTGAAHGSARRFHGGRRPGRRRNTVPPREGIESERLLGAFQAAVDKIRERTQPWDSWVQP